MNKLLSTIDIGTSFTYGGNSLLTDPRSIGKITSSFLATSISVAGILLLFLLIGGGIAIIAGAGNSDPKAVEGGKKAATSALIGFVVVFSAYWIVRLVEVVTGVSLLQ